MSTKDIALLCTLAVAIGAVLGLSVHLWRIQRAALGAQDAFQGEAEDPPPAAEQQRDFFRHDDDDDAQQAGQPQQQPKQDIEMQPMPTATGTTGATAAAPAAADEPDVSHLLLPPTSKGAMAIYAKKKKTLTARSKELLRRLPLRSIPPVLLEVCEDEEEDEEVASSSSPVEKHWWQQSP